MNLEGIALKLLLEETDKQKALEYFGELKPQYFSAAFSSILLAINDFYDHHATLPSLEELQVFRSRDRKTSAALATLSLTNTDNIDAEFVVDELANQHAQTHTLDLIDKVLATISVKDRYELLDSMAAIPMQLEELIEGSNCVFTPKNLSLFPKKEVIQRYSTGISNDFDADTGGYYRQDLILLGGKRGSGKSVVCANLMYNQHMQGNPSIYFTIEMTAHETYMRFLGMKAGVDAIKIKMDTTSTADKIKLAGAAATLFVGGEELFSTTLEKSPTPDFDLFETELRKLDEKEEGRIIIHDDMSLKLSSIDNIVATYRNRYGNKLFLIVVDYINRVTLDGSVDKFDWKDQTLLADKLKTIARKHDVCLVSPYQMDEAGNARFSKGILDACDVAQLIQVKDKEDNSLIFETVKARSADDTGKYKVGIDWKTLLIDPRPIADLDGGDNDSEPSKSKGTRENTTMELQL